MTEFRYRKSQQNLNWSPFFLAITTPHAHGDLDGSIMSYSSKRFDFFSTRVRFVWGHAPRPLPVWYRVFLKFNFMSTKLQHPISALCLEKTSSFRSSTSLIASSCSSFSLPLKCSISGRTGLSICISSSVGRSGKFEQLESPSSVSDLSDLIRPEESFILCNRLKIQILSLWLDNQQLHFVLSFQLFHIEF